MYILRDLNLVSFAHHKKEKNVFKFLIETFNLKRRIDGIIVKEDATLRGLDTSVTSTSAVP